MDHDGALPGAILSHILKLEVEGHLEVQLNGAALPGTTQAVTQVEVNLRAVERAVALVDDIGHAQLLQGRFQAVGRILPVLVGAHRILRAGGQLDKVFKAELGVHLIDQRHHPGDLIGNLLAGHEDMGIILGEAAHAEQAVERALQFVAVHQAQLAAAQGQVTVGMGLVLVHHHAAGAVHGLDAEVLVIDLGGVHVVLVVIPVAGGLPQAAVHHHGGGNLHIARGVVDVAPVVDQGVLDEHALGQEEGEAGALLGEHEQTHFLADLAVVALLGFSHHVLVLRQFLAVAEGDAADAGKHLVVLVVLPVRAGNRRQLEGLERLGVAQMRADAHVDVIALLVEGERHILSQVADVLDLVGFAALVHQLDGLVPGQGEGLDGQVLLDDGLHFLLDGGQVLLGELHITQINVIVEAVLGGGAVGEMRLGVEVLHGLGQDVSCAVAQDVQFLLRGALGHMTVVVDHLHGNSSFFAWGMVKKMPIPRLVVSRDGQKNLHVVPP